MTPATFLATALDPGLGLLRVDLDTLAARAFLLAIALHESALAHRRQVSGPAKGYFQFERAGVVGVLHHPASRTHVTDVLQRLDYGGLLRRPKAIQAVLEHHDPLAVVFARLLLRSLPDALPSASHERVAYAQYRAAWRPNPQKADLRSHEWPGHWAAAWQTFLETNA